MTPSVRGAVDRLDALRRGLYRGGRPGAFMRVVNRVDALLYATGLVLPRRAAVLEVTGRRTGRPVRLPVVVVGHAGEQYLVSMLGQEASWVRNVRAAHGRARLCRRRREAAVVLEEVPVGHRAPVLRRYLAVAPGARPHVAVDPGAPLPAFAAVAHRYPVFRVRPAEGPVTRPGTPTR